MKQVIRGTSIKVTATFTASGVLTDPTTITLEVSNPHGDIVAYLYSLSQLTKASTGVFYRNVLLSSEGVWAFRMTGTGTVATSTITYVECRSDVFL